MVQLTDELLRRLDDRAIQDGVSRSQVIREAITSHLAQDDHQRAVRQFEAAYREHPEEPGEMAIAESNARQMVTDEPW